MSEIYALEFQLAHQRGYVSGVKLSPGSITLDGWIRFASTGLGLTRWRPILVYGHHIVGEPPPVIWITLIARMLGANGHLEVYSEYAPGLGHYLESTSDLRDDTWHHFAWSIDHYTNTGRLFIDGLKEAEGTQMFYPHPEDAEIYVGWRTVVTRALAIDDLRLSRVARYHENFTPQPLQWRIDGATEAYWHLDEGSGDVAYDASPQARHLVLEAAPSWISGIVEKGVIIMPIVSHCILGIDYLAAVPEWVGPRWNETLKGRAAHFAEQLKKLVPDESQFQQVIAGPANQAYGPFVNPAYVSRGGDEAPEIIAKHAVNLRQAYAKWLTQLDQIYETVEGVPTKRFKERAEVNLPHFLTGVARWTIPFTGVSVENRGPAPMAVFWLVGDPKVVGWLRPIDRVLEGGPYRICVPTKSRGLKAMLLQQLVKAGVTMIKANFVPTVMTKVNQLTNEQVQGFVDPALSLVPFTAGGDSKVDYILDENKQLYLEIKVSKM